jgi:GNAT superfamily N-acetyltransferase
MKEVRYAQCVKEIEACWEVVEALRPHLKKEKFVEQVQQMMEEGYQMVYISEDEKPVAFAGFRNMQMLYCGSIIYIDDLSTLPAYRGKGYAGRLLDYIHNLAGETGKSAVHLDSGYQRNDAHRLYLSKGYILSSHHFSKQIR